MKPYLTNKLSEYVEYGNKNWHINIAYNGEVPYYIQESDS